MSILIIAIILIFVISGLSSDNSSDKNKKKSTSSSSSHSTKHQNKKKDDYLILLDEKPKNEKFIAGKASGNAGKQESYKSLTNSKSLLEKMEWFASTLEQNAANLSKLNTKSTENSESLPFIYLYHFTRYTNIQNIRTYGILSREELWKNHIPCFTGGNDLSISLDERDNLSQYARLSFSYQLPMLYKLLAEGQGPIALLKIKNSVFWDSYCVSDINATDNNRKLYYDKKEALKNLDFDAINEKLYNLSKGSECYKKHQAEVLIRQVKPDLIVNLDNPIILNNTNDFNHIWV